MSEDPLVRVRVPSISTGSKITLGLVGALLAAVLSIVPKAWDMGTHVGSIDTTLSAMKTEIEGAKRDIGDVKNILQSVDVRTAASLSTISERVTRLEVRYDTLADRMLKFEAIPPK
jgi:hypothetical protein